MLAGEVDLNSWYKPEIDKKILKELSKRSDTRGIFDISLFIIILLALIDTDGCVWNCRWGGSCIVRFTPYGKVDQIIEMPVQNITNCIFGGSDMKTLFITTASNEGKNKNDLDGSLFSINLNYQGIEDNKSKLELS